MLATSDDSVYTDRRLTTCATKAGIMRKKIDRIPVTPELRRDLKAFRDGLDVADYEAAIQFMLQDIAARYNHKGDMYNLGKKLQSTQSESAKVR